jgi:hypothetical protein
MARRLKYEPTVISFPVPQIRPIGQSILAITSAILAQVRAYRRTLDHRPDTSMGNRGVGLPAQAASAQASGTI